MADEETGEVELRDYAMVLMDLPQAQLEATQKLNEAIEAVMRTKKGGSVTLKFNLSVGKVDEATLEINPVVTAAIPKRALKGGVFYPDKHNNPTKDDPSQLWRGEDIQSAPTFRGPDEGSVKKAPSTDVATATPIKKAPTR